MLGGFDYISTIDAAGSAAFLAEFVMGTNPRISKSVALDCGAGIGRVSKNLLLKIFETVDLLEQNPDFLEQAKTYIAQANTKNKLGKLICSGLQSFVPDSKRYDCVWIQWVLGYLTDEDLVQFFKRCVTGLKKGGIICVKDNINKKGFIVHKDDSSITRSDEHYKEIFKKSGLQLIKEKPQTQFPEFLFVVMMYALVPETYEDQISSNCTSVSPPQTELHTNNVSS